MPIRGDINGMKKLSDRIRYLTTPDFRAKLGKVLAATAQRQVLEGFRDSRDPYGKPWAKLRSRKGKPLIDTGQMRQSVSVESSADRVKIRIGAWYAQMHQEGWTIRAHHRRAGTIFKNKAGRFRSREQMQRANDAAYNRWAKQMEKWEDGLRKTQPRRPGSSITESARAAYTHKGGTVPQRRMVPDRGHLGPIWEKALNEAAGGLIRRTLGYPSKGSSDDKG